MLNRDLNALITNENIGEKLDVLLKELKIPALLLPECRGYDLSGGIFDFLGFVDKKKVLVLFQSGERNRKIVIDNILESYNKPGNGILFTIKGEKMKKSEGKMYIAIVNQGYGEKIADLLKKHCKTGATVFDARGSGTESNQFMGMQIDTHKEVVLSLMPEKSVNVIEKIVKEEFNTMNTDVFSFVMSVDNFHKLHRDEPSQGNKETENTTETKE